MKKFLAILLTVVTIFTCCSLAVFAANENEQQNYTKSYSVTVEPDSVKMIEIESLSGSNYVEEGKSFEFRINTVGSYTFDQTTVIKVVNVNHHIDVIQGNEKEYAYILEPDANGVYRIESVTEDLYVYPANLSTASLAGIKDFLFNMFYFFLNWMKWFFGLR